LTTSATPDGSITRSDGTSAETKTFVPPRKEPALFAIIPYPSSSSRIEYAVRFWNGK
jgi:hypothetical protein